MKEDISEKNLELANAELGTNYDDWHYINFHKGLTEEFMLKYRKHLDFSHLINEQFFSEEFIEKHLNKMSLHNVLKRQNVSNEFIIKHSDDFSFLEWDTISSFHALTEEMIIKFIDNIKICSLLTNRKINLTEDFIKKLVDRFTDGDWYTLVEYHKLSEEFMMEYAEQISLKDNFNVLTSQELSEDFIKKYFTKKELFSYIPHCQNVSDEFLESINKKRKMKKVVYHCGRYKRMIFVRNETPTLIRISCFTGTKEEAIARVNNTYGKDTQGAKDYIQKIEECFNF